MKKMLKLGVAWVMGISLVAQADDVFKADNADALNLTSSWVGGAATPGENDRAVFDNTITAHRSTALGADTSWNGIFFNNNAYTWTISGANKLTLGAGGVDMSMAGFNGTNLAISANVEIGASQTWTMETSRTGLVSGVMSGSAGTTLTKSGAGMMVLMGDNTFAGDVLINGGALIVGNATTSGSFASAGSITVTNNAQMVYWGAAGKSFTNQATVTITGQGTVGRFADEGALTVRGNSTRLVQQGAIVLAGNARIGAYGVTVSNVLDGAISGTGNLSLLAKAGSSSHNAFFYLNAANTYTGNTTLDTIAANNITTLGVDNALPTNTVLTMGQYRTAVQTNYSKLVLNGKNQTLAGIISTANLYPTATNRIVGGSATLSTLTINNTANYNFGNEIGGPAANENNLRLVKMGTGALTLSSNNTYTGGTLVSGGALVFAKPGSKPASGTVQVDAGAAFGLGVGGAGYFSASDVDSLWVGGMANVNMDAGALVAIDTTGGNFTYSTGQSTRGLVKLGVNTLTLEGANTYTGGTIIGGGSLLLNNASGVSLSGDVTMAGGYLQLGAANQMADTSVITFAAGVNGRLQMQGFNDILGGIQDLGGAGTRIVEAAQDGVSDKPAELGINVTGANAYTFSGYMRDAAGASNSALSIVKDGTGTQTFSGSPSLVSYKGATVINAGVLEFSGAGSVANNSAITVNGGYVKFSGGGTRTNTIDGAGGLIQAGGGSTMLTLSGANTYTGGTRLEGGVLVLDNATGESLPGDIIITNGLLRLARADQIADTAVITLDTTHAAGKRFQMQGFNETIGGLSDSGVGANLCIVEASSDFSVDKSATLTLNVTGANAYVYSGLLRDASSATNSVLSLVKDGTGTQTLRYAMHTGTTVINNGLLEFSGASGVVNGSAITVNGGNVKFSGGGTRTNTIAGAGGLIKDGNNTLTLAGANTYTGDTVVNAGTLVVNGSIAGGLITDAGTVLGGSGTVSGAAVISGTHNPGNSPGLQVFEDDLTYNNGSAINWELTANALDTRGTDYDGINVGGDLTINDTSTINLVFNGTGSAVDWADAFWNANRSWTFYDVTGSRTGAFTLGTVSKDSLGQDALGSFSIGYSGSDVLINYTAIPEPAAISLMVLAGVGCLLRRRTR